MNKQFPARLHVLLAHNAEIGVVIRRGPSRHVCTILWNRKTDEFQLGQWLKGRIYERRCDLSPDGKYMIYFAMNGRWQSKTGGSWTAISQAPYLKAISLFAKGDCWHGGGLFTSKRRYWLNDGCGHTQLANSPDLRRDTNYIPIGGYGGECLSVYYPRLQRDGWDCLEQQNVGKWKDIHIFQKKLTDGWVLRKIAHSEIGAPVGKGCYWDEHCLYHPSSELLLSFPDWEWADVERTRLVWAANGQLFSGHVNDNKIHNQKMLYDFNPMKFEAIEAPY